jgi:hypothetical protein
MAVTALLAPDDPPVLLAAATEGVRDLAAAVVDSPGDNVILIMPSAPQATRPGTAMMATEAAMCGSLSSSSEGSRPSCASRPVTLDTQHHSIAAHDDHGIAPPLVLKRMQKNDLIGCSSTGKLLNIMT